MPRTQSTGLFLCRANDEYLNQRNVSKFDCPLKQHLSTFYFSIHGITELAEDFNNFFVAVCNSIHHRSETICVFDVNIIPPEIKNKTNLATEVHYKHITSIKAHFSA